MILILACSFMGLVACGGAGGDEDIDPNRTQITLVIKNDSIEKLIASKLKTQFEIDNPDLQIVIRTTLGADYAKSIFNFSATEFPDLIWSGGDVHQAVSAAGKFEDLKPYFDRDFPEWETEFSEVSIRSTHYSSTDTGIWFAPRDYNKLVIMYNKDIFENAMSHDPTIKLPSDPSYFENGRTGWTWEEFEDTLRKFRVLIEDDSVNGYGLTRTSYPFVGQLSWNPMYYTLVKGFGGEILDGTNVMIDDADTRVALEKIRTLTSDKLSTNNSGAFNNKLAAMSVAVRTSVAGAIASGLNVDVAPFPVMPTNVVGAGCSGYAMSATSEHKEEAWKFLKFMLSEEGQEIISQTQAIVPVRTDLFDKADAEWRKSTPDLNNDAFVSEPEKTLHLNFADAVEPNNQGAVYQDLNDFFYSLTDTRYQGDDGLTTLIGVYKTKITNSIQGITG